MPRNGTASAPLPALENLYDHIWIYGIPEICDPLDGIEVSDAVRQKTRFTGYLRRGKTPSGFYPPPHEIEEPFFLVTTGGGGDGAMLVDWVLRAYEFDPTLDMPAKIVLGPFMGTSQQTGFMERVARLKHIEAITFEANMEALMQRALGVVAMGGYNTFCEILSLDKRALIVPRTAPRAEQFIRATRAEELGLVSMLMPDDTTDPRQMVEALRALPYRRRPSKVHIPGLLDGLSVINSLVDQYLGDSSAAGRGRRASPSAGRSAARCADRAARMPREPPRLHDQPADGAARAAGGGGAAHRRSARAACSSLGSAAAAPSIIFASSCRPRDLRLRPRDRGASEMHPRRRPSDPWRDPRDAEVLRAAHSGKAGLHPCRSRLRRPDAGSDHALLAVAARRRMGGAGHDHPCRPAARGQLPRAAAPAGLPEVGARAAPRRVGSRAVIRQADAHRVLRAPEAAGPSCRLRRPRHGAGA